MKAGPAEPVTEAVPGKERETLPDGTTLFRFGPPVDKGPVADPGPRVEEPLATPVPAKLVPFLDLVEDERTLELNGRPVPVELVPFIEFGGREEDERIPELERGKPVPVELGGDVEFVNLPRLKEDGSMPELDPPVGVMLPLGLKLLELDIVILGVTGRVELVELLLRREEEPPVGAVTPVIRPEPDGVNADASLAIAKATRTMSKPNFMIAGDERD